MVSLELKKAAITMNRHPLPSVCSDGVTGWDDGALGRPWP